MEKNSFKPYPCGIVIHPIIDGCSQLRSEGLRSEEISRVTLTVHPLVLELTGRKHPKDGLEAKFSVYFGAACGFLFGKATPTEYTEAIVKQTAELREMTTANVDPNLSPDECRIAVRTRAKPWKKHVEHAVGSLANPMSNEQFQQKFQDQVSPVIGPQSSTALFSALEKIVDSSDVAEMLQMR